MSADNAFAELIHEYVGECLPLAEEAADGFLELERRWNADLPVDDLAPRLKGLIHTVKGNSAMMGQAAAADTAHTIEDLLATLLADATQRDSGTLNLLLDGADTLIELVRGAASEKTNPARAEAWVAAVRTQLAGQAAPAASAGAGAAPRAASAPDAVVDTVRVDFRQARRPFDALVAQVVEGQIAGRDVQKGLGARHRTRGMGPQQAAE